MTLVRSATMALALVTAPTLGLAAEGLATDANESLRRALGFLLRQQVREPLDVTIGGVRVRDYPGNWPQFFRLEGTQVPRVRDVSPFVVAFIHHSLTHVVKANRKTLGSRRRDLRAARFMRRRAIQFLSRFESPAGRPDAGTYAFWPYDAYPDRPRPFVELVLVSWLRGPFLGGERVPLNLPAFPSALAIPSDADVTATTYAALFDHATFDGGHVSEVPFHEFFIDWRDLGVVPRRLNPSWLPPASGAFLTWLAYREPNLPLFPNDVDLVVNANVLYALGRYDRLHVPGVGETVELINEVTALGLHRDGLQQITEYYPDNLMFQYAVSRAYHEGGVAALAPAVEILADDLEASAIDAGDGTAHWDHGAPHLNTAFAMLTLLNAGRDTPLLEGAADYLIAEQSFWGAYDAAPFFIARTGGGQVFEFFSASFTTAMALEALARYLLARERKSF